jgi:hypothetical protein
MGHGMRTSGRYRGRRPASSVPARGNCGRDTKKSTPNSQPLPLVVHNLGPIAWRGCNVPRRGRAEWWLSLPCLWWAERLLERWDAVRRHPAVTVAHLDLRVRAGHGPHGPPRMDRPSGGRGRDRAVRRRPGSRRPFRALNCRGQRVGSRPSGVRQAIDGCNYTCCNYVPHLGVRGSSGGFSPQQLVVQALGLVSPTSSTH